MERNSHISRFNPIYLAGRHAGTVFLFLSFGLFLGLAFRDLAQPYSCRSEAEIPLALDSAAAGDIDWEAWLAGKRTALASESERRLLVNNLRWLVKMSATSGFSFPHDGNLSNFLGGFSPPQAYSPAMLPEWLPNWIRPEEEIRPGLRDFALNLDFQTLAIVVDDLSLVAGGDADQEMGKNLAVLPDAAPEEILIAGEASDNAFFRAFRRLYARLRPEHPEPTANEVWLFAANEVAERLELEANIPGSGGFGVRAGRELAREIAALPILIANRLYRVFPAETNFNNFGGGFPAWDEIWSRNTLLDLRTIGNAPPRLAAEVELALNPLAPPRNAAATRLSPLAAQTLLLHLSASEKQRNRETPASDMADAPALSVPDPAPEYPADDGTDGAAEAMGKEIAARAEAEEMLRGKIRDGENLLRQAGIVRDAARLRLDTARDREKRLAAEALAARARADRLDERVDAARIGEEAKKEGIRLDQAKLFSVRDVIQARLARLLQYCSEEHPFVKRTRRDLAAVETLLAEKIEDGKDASEETGAVRLAGLESEHESALALAGGLEERLRRQAAEAESALAALAAAEKAVKGREAELAIAREDLSRLASLSRPPPKPEPEPAATTTTAAAVSAAAGRPGPAGSQPGFSALPEGGNYLLSAPDWHSLTDGLALGLLLGLIWILAREILVQRFSSVLEAECLTGLPFLLALPAYDPGSFRRAAKGAGGTFLDGGTGRLTFIPETVDKTVPKATARRAKLIPARRFPKIAAWVLGAILLAGGWLLHRAHEYGFHQSAASSVELAPLAAVLETIRLSLGAEDGKWGADTP
ncbi:MAG: hypothetical protein LBE84_08425 [Planctomycetota bacterium]|jgi:hypothetical protein|nr:hypothetical protein [Planctomycetota bacterium]